MEILNCSAGWSTSAHCQFSCCQGTGDYYVPGPPNHRRRWSWGGRFGPFRLQVTPAAPLEQNLAQIAWESPWVRIQLVAQIPRRGSGSLSRSFRWAP